MKSDSSIFLTFPNFHTDNIYTHHEVFPELPKRSLNDLFFSKEYWADHSAPTIEKMMLDTDAASIDKLERPECLGDDVSFFQVGVRCV